MSHNHHHHHHEGAAQAPSTEDQAPVDVAVLKEGDLPVQEASEQDPAKVRAETEVNHENHEERKAVRDALAKDPVAFAKAVMPEHFPPAMHDHTQEAASLPTEYPSGVFAETPPEEEHHRDVNHNELFINWMRARFPKHLFFDTAEHSIVEILEGLPVVSSDWKVLQRGLFQKLAQKLLQTTFMPYLMDGETVPFLTPKFNYLAYVIIQNAAITFNVHVIVPQGTPGAILPPFPNKVFPAQTLLLLGLPDLGPRAMEIKLLRDADPAMRVLTKPVISMTQALTEQNRFNLGRGCLRYTAPPQKRERPMRRNQSQAAMAMAMMASTIAPQK